MDTLTIKEKDSFLPLYNDNLNSFYNEAYRNLLFTDREFVESLADFYQFYAPIYAEIKPDLIVANFKELLFDYDKTCVNSLVNWFSSVVHNQNGYSDLRSQTLEDLTQRYLAVKLKVDEKSDSIKHEPYLMINNNPLFKQAKYVNFDFVSLNDKRLYAYDAKSTLGGFLKHVVAKDSYSAIVRSKSDDSNDQWVTILIEMDSGTNEYLNNIADFDSGYEKLQYGNLLKKLPTKVDNVDNSDVYFATYAEYGIKNMPTKYKELEFSNNDHINRIIFFLKNDQFANQGLNILPFQELLSEIFGPY